MALSDLNSSTYVRRKRTGIMESSRSAFITKPRANDELIGIDATSVHIVSYVTGGLGRLLHQIKENEVPILQEYGHYTNDKGQFDPQGSCLMGLRYHVKQIVDSEGYSAVLVLAEDLFQSNRLVVIKVLHSQLYKVGSQESHNLWKLAMADPFNYSHTLRILTTFSFDSHYCLVFEPLLPDPLTSIFQEFPQQRILPHIKKVGLRLLATVGFLHQQDLIHADLKPDNILLKFENDLDSVHVVDFGNAVNYVHSELSLYYKDFEIQTPVYRAPEVMYGVPFGPEIDIWSLGCILAELFLGKPLFLGDTKDEILLQMYELLGPFPTKLFRRGMYYKDFKPYTSSDDQPNASTNIFDHLQCQDYMFADLIAGMLRYNPAERLTVSEAAQHPFFASYFPVSFLVPASGVKRKHLSVPLSQQAYQYSPEIAADIKKGQLSSTDLLRLGTSEPQSSSNQEEIAILKPSPRYKMKGENLSLLETSTQLFPCGDYTVDASSTRKHPETGQSDMSVVRNVISERMDKFPNNIKENMSSLLKAIRQEQNLVDNDIERRLNNSSNMAFPNTRKGTDSTVSIRPVPTYRAYKENSVGPNLLHHTTFKEPVTNRKAFSKFSNSTGQVEKSQKSVKEDTFLVKGEKTSNFLDTYKVDSRKPGVNMHEMSTPVCNKSSEFTKRAFALKNSLLTSKHKEKSLGKCLDMRREAITVERITGSNGFCKEDSHFGKISQTVTTKTVDGHKKGKPDVGTHTYSHSSEGKLVCQNWNKSPSSGIRTCIQYKSSSADRVSKVKGKTTNTKLGSDLSLSERKTPLTKPENRKRMHVDCLSDDEVVDVLSPLSNRSSQKRHKRIVKHPDSKLLSLFPEIGQKSGINMIPRQLSHTRNVTEKFQSDDLIEPGNELTSVNSQCVSADEETEPVSDGNYIQGSPLRKMKQISSNKQSEKNSQITRERKLSLHSEKKLNYVRENQRDREKSSYELYNYKQSSYVHKEKNKTQRQSDLHYIRESRYDDSVKKIKCKPVSATLGEMPTPIPKLTSTVTENNDAVADSPEIVYKSFQQQLKDLKRTTLMGNKNQGFHHRQVSDTEHLLVKGSKGLSRKFIVDKTGKQFKNVSCHRRKGETINRDHVKQNYSKTPVDSKHALQQRKEHDQFSFIETPASDRKMEGAFVQIIAERRRKLKRKARKNLNFKELEDYTEDISDDDDMTDTEYIDTSNKDELNHHIISETDYPAIGQGTHYLELEHQGKKSLNDPDHFESRTRFHEPNQKLRNNAIYSNDNLSGQLDVSTTGTTQYRQPVGRVNKIKKMDSTFVVDFESPMKYE